MSQFILFSRDNIDINCPEELCLAISFDYLISPNKQVSYEYYQDLYDNKSRKNMLLVSRKFKQLTLQYLKKLQLWRFSNSSIPYYFNYYYHTFTYCWFVSNKKYFFTDDAAEWSVHKSKLYSNSHRITRMWISIYIFDSIIKYKLNCVNNLLKKYHLDPQLTRNSFKCGLLHNTDLQWKTILDLKKKKHRMTHGYLGLVRFKKTMYEIRRPMVELKIQALVELISSRRKCQYPLCTTTVFKPKTTCCHHRYLDIFKNRTIKPSTKQLLNLERSIVIV